MLKRTLAFTSVFVSLAAAAHAVTIAVQPVSATAGDTPDVCVVIPDNDGQVSGIQTDLTWDSSCLTADVGGGDEAACAVNPDTNRTTFRTKIVSPSSMRVIMLNISDTTPIPASVQQLFCCQFRVSPAAGGRTCAISPDPSKTIASNPTGTRLQVTARAGAVAISGGSGSQGGGAAGAGMMGGVMVPPMVTGGNQAAGTTGGANTGGTAAGSGAAAAAGAVKGALPQAPAMPQMPGMPGAPAAVQKAEDVVQGAKETAGAVLGTPNPAATAQKTAAAGTPSPKTTAKETPKAQGTPTPESKSTAPAGTPTPK